MVRNIVLLISTLAVLSLLFVSYWLLVDDPVIRDQDEAGTAETLPVGEAGEGGAPLRIANVGEIAPGQGAEFTIYDERTGRATQHFHCEEWIPLGNDRNEIRVVRPRLTMLLSSSMSVDITAAEGELAVDRLEKAQGRPKRGVLRGGVQIVLDRGPRPAADGAEPTPNLVTVTLDEMQFDLELGEVHTAGPLRVVGDEFELSGTGLDVVWNQADNVIESLVLRQGESLVLKGRAGLFREDTAEAEAPEEPAAPPPEPAEPRRPGQTYACRLSEAVSVEQLAGEDVVGQLVADEVHLLFDVSGTADRFMQRTTPTPTAPAASRPVGPPQQVVVRWQGPLTLEPEVGGAAEQSRRRFEAIGNPVVLAHADGRVRCGRLEFHDDTQQIWLHAGDSGHVDFDMGDSLSASAESVYINQATHLVKLIGDVRLDSRSGTPGKPGHAIRCSLWAELHLSAGRAAPAGQTEDLLRAGQLESATFVGEAQVGLGGQTLAADRIEATFRQTDDQAAPETALETAIATGNVRLSREDEALECARLDLTFAQTDQGQLYPRTMDAHGSVLIARGRSWVAGDHVHADLAPAPPTQRPGGPEFVLAGLQIEGQAELRDPPNRVAARAALITATFTEGNQLSEASVHGTADRPGVVYAAPYAVAGKRIDLAWEAQTLDVDGAARLRFKTRRGLRGQRREQPVPVDITCSRTLHIDGRRNTIHFAGDVKAVSGDEQLLADTLTLLLQDMTAPEDQAPPTPSLTDLLRHARTLLSEGAQTTQQGDWLSFQAEPRERIRKEPLRLIADNATVLSETPAPDGEPPLVHFSIRAPRLEVDIVHREILTQGQTKLGFLSRRLEDDGAPPETLGIPSGLIARGPSQTAMQCERSLTYVLGEETLDGTPRRDSVLFEGDVLFIHRTGREMVDLEQMLPQVRTNPELISNYESRNTSLQCDRLECGILVGGGDELGRATSMRLTWLLASGHAYLRDLHNDIIREVWAAQLDFDRTLRLIRVLGGPRVDARIYESSREAADSRAIVGAEFIINLQDGTVKTGATRGEFRDQ
ncbi:MAG: hypothetical protein PVJ57_21020 [Phycisphaerae bacterium]|jgi:hypothetical protein